MRGVPAQLIPMVATFSWNYMGPVASPQGGGSSDKNFQMNHMDYLLSLQGIPFVISSRGVPAQLIPMVATFSWNYMGPIASPQGGSSSDKNFQMNHMDYLLSLQGIPFVISSRLLASSLHE
ncbi:unnamed protein product [Urochloa humidicola]